MTRRLLGYVTLLSFFLVACSQVHDRASSLEADAGAWAVVDADDSITLDGASLPEVADSSLGVDANPGDAGQGGWDATGDGAGEVSASDVTEPTPDASATPSWGGGVLLYELASDFLNVAGAGARFTEAASGPGTVDEAADQWGPCAASVSDPDAPEVVEVGFDAGVITTMGTTSEVILNPQNEGADGVGYSSNLDDDLEGLLTPGGALITVFGAGGADIEPFELVVQVPEPVTLSSPETGLFKSVGTSSDLTVHWNAGTGEAILVTATPLDDAFQSAPGVGLICGAQEDSGSLVIPAQAMAAMKASGVNRVALAVTRLRFGTALVGEKLVTATVTRSSGGPLDLN
jgi:hypothetical protein